MAKTIQIEIPKEAASWAKKHNVSIAKLGEFAKVNARLDLLLLASRMDSKSAALISKRVGKSVWTKL